MARFRNKTRTLENIAGGSYAISTEDAGAISNVIKEHPVKGGRYFGNAEDDAQTWGWIRHLVKSWSVRTDAHFDKETKSNVLLILNYVQFIVQVSTMSAFTF